MPGKKKPTNKAESKLQARKLDDKDLKKVSGGEFVITKQMDVSSPK